MPDRKFQGPAYRFGFNGKENDNEAKGFGNEQDYGMRIYDVRYGRFLSLDPLSPNYPYLTPYQFASNRPIDGIDRDGLEFLKYNDSYIKMSVDYDPKLKTVQATTFFRVGESQRDRWPGRTILTGVLEERIKNTPAPCDNCIPNYDSRVSKIRLQTPPQETQMSDATDNPKNVSPQEFRTLRMASNNKERNEIERTREFYTPGISNNISKWDGRLAFVEATGIALQAIG